MGSRHVFAPFLLRLVAPPPSPTLTTGVTTVIIIYIICTFSWSMEMRNMLTRSGESNPYFLHSGPPC